MVPLDVAELIRGLGRALSAGLTDALLVVDAPEPATVMGDPAAVSAAVQALVHHAGQGTAPGTIRVQVRTAFLDADHLARMQHEDGVVPGPFVLIEVQDTGYAPTEATSARELVRSHRGALEVQHISGIGTTITIALPKGAAKGQRTVLVVDDEAMIRDVARTMLERSGYRVLLAEEGEAALKIYRADPAAVDAVLLDLTMPGMSGAQTLSALRLVDPAVRVVVCSGYTAAELSDELGGATPAGFLQKPYNMRQLSGAVGAALEGKS